MIEARPEVASLPPYRPGRPAGAARGLINLAANENGWGPSPRAVAALSGLPLHRYPDMDGPELLDRLAAVWGLEREQLLLGTGSGHLIKCVAEAFVRPRDRVVTVRPTFSLYATSAALMGGAVRSLPLDDSAVPFAKLPAFVRQERPRLVFVCSPNNPTGDLLDEPTLERLLGALPSDGLLVLDEAYVHFAQNPPDALRRVRAGEPVAVLRTFSKAYGLASLRLGVLTAPESVIQAVRRVREPFPASAPALCVAAAAVDDGDHLDAVQRVVRRARAELREALATRGFQVGPGEGNFLWAEVPGGSGAELVQALRGEGVLIRDGNGFGVPSHVRVSVGPEAEQAQLFAALDRVLPLHPDR